MRGAIWIISGDQAAAVVEKQQKVLVSAGKKPLRKTAFCGHPLEYLSQGRISVCVVCGRSEMGNVYCPEGHYVCESCHGEGLFEAILSLSLSSQSADPLAIAEEIIRTTPLPMLGCEHSWIAAGALLAAIRNHGGIKVTDEQIAEALNRTRKQAMAAYCGLTGVCGVAPVIGASFSVILGATCPKDWETATVMRVVSRVIEAIANQTGPCCCKKLCAYSPNPKLSTCYRVP